VQPLASSLEARAENKTRKVKHDFAFTGLVPRRPLWRDIGRGRKLFEENCAKCHNSRRDRGRVGPDLSSVNMKTKEELLTSIVNPSYAIEPRFTYYMVTTKDGRISDGVISNETPGMITLRGGSDEGDETILRTNIAQMHASTLSLMPDGLEKVLGRQGLDSFSF
jgi:putative heme-binding domain-containing protein